MKFARLLLRLVVGALFIGHGTQKLLGWFGGQGLDATGQMFDSIGARPGRVNAIAAGTAEAGGGTLLALGLATPLAASGLIATMLTAINRVHLKNGPWNANGGYEFPLVMIAAVLALVEAEEGPRWALASLLTGIAGAAGAHAYSAMQPEPQPESAPAEEPLTEREPVAAPA